MPKLTELELGLIVVGPRFRKDLGDVKSLADDIQEVGLLHPVVVTEDLELIAGYRRLKAAELLGWETIPVTVVSVEDVRRAEISENTARKDFTVKEVKAVYDYLHPKLEAEAKQRQEATQLVGKGIQAKDINGASNLDEPLEKGRTDEKIARYVGMGKDTLRKVLVIAEEGKPEEVKEADRKRGMVSKVYNKIKKRKNLERAHREGSPPHAGGGVRHNTS